MKTLPAQEGASRKLVVVLGMHRSGTSAITRCLQCVGVDLGDDLVPAGRDNVKGFWEDRDILQLNKDILSHIGMQWHTLQPICEGHLKSLDDAGFAARAVDLLRGKMRGKACFGFKDPRTAKLLPFWRRVFSQMDLDVRYVLCTRNPMSVARSLKVRNQMPLEKGYLLWLEHVLTALVYALDSPAIGIDYDQLLASPREQIARIAKWLGTQLSLGELDAVECQFLDDSLRHSHNSRGELEGDSSAFPLVAEIYRCVLEEGLSCGSLGSNVIRSKVESWSRLYELSRPALVAVDSLSLSLEALQSRAKEREGELNNKLKRISTDHEKACRLRDERITSLTQRADQAKAELAILKKSNLELSQKLEGRAVELTRLVELKQLVRRKDAKLAELKAIIEQYRSSTSWRVTAPLRMLAQLLHWLQGVVCRALRPVWRLFTSQFQLVARAVLPYYQTIVPRRIKELVPLKVWLMVKRQLELKEEEEAAPQSYLDIRVDQPVAVIVPIFNALEDLECGVRRLLEYTSPSVDIILIDDASTDKNVARFLDSLRNIPQVRVFRNETNLGFTRTVNYGISLAGRNDVVLLNSDARVTPRWLEGLRRALSSGEKVATVTPMSDRAGAFSAPNTGNDNRLPEGVREEDYAVLFRRFSSGSYPAVPTGNGFCMYIRRACIDEVGLLDADAFPRGYGEENDFCMRAGRAGWMNIIDDRTYVFHARSKSFGAEKTDLIESGRKVIDTRYPEYKNAIKVFRQSPLLVEARARAAQALREIEGERRVKPRVLFVISTVTGGTPQTNRDLMLALSCDIEPWLLHCDASTISIYKVCRDQEDVLMRRHFLSCPLEPLTHISDEYDRVVSNWLFEIDFSLVHIRHLAWHSLNLPRLAKVAGAKVVKSFHDFYSVCPTVKLVDEAGKYCAGSCSATTGDCTIDLWRDKKVIPRLKNGWVVSWRKNFKERVIDHCDSFVTTHASARDVVSEAFSIPLERFHVIPHGRDFNDFGQLAEEYKTGEVLKILVPGNIGQAKGRDIIKGLVELDRGRRLHFHVLGKCDLKSQAGLTLHGTYSRDEFATYVKKISPHVGAVLSIWNETWCHTLTELWSVGVPAIVTDFPTLRQRVEESGAGWVVDHSDLCALYESIVESIATTHAVAEKIENTVLYQGAVMTTATSRAMAASYRAVYGMDGAAGKSDLLLVHPLICHDDGRQASLI